VTANGILGFGKDVGSRLRLIGILPGMSLGAFIAGLLLAGAPGQRPSLPCALAKAGDISPASAVLIVLSLLVFALITQPLHLSLVRVLEGYWGGSRLTTGLRKGATILQVSRRQKIVARRDQPLGTDQAQARAVAASWALRHRYPRDEHLVMPTALGNVLRAAEARAGRRYDLNAVVVWPRLYPLLPPPVARIVEDARNQLDVTARFTVIFLTAALVSVPLLAAYGVWLLVPAGAAALSWVSYRAAIAAAISYGMGVETAFDLHRFDLLAAMHLPLPATRSVERDLNKRLSEFLRAEFEPHFAYRHPASH
jgi:hypothetical protein